MRADTGPIGGDLSHEFIILAETGESEVFCHARLLDMRSRRPTPTSHAATCQPIVDHWTSLYAATDEKHDAAAFDASAGGQADLGARHRGRPYLLFRHQVFGADGRQGDRAGRHRSTSSTWAPTASASIAPRRRDHRGEPRRAGIIWPEAVAPFDVGAHQSQGRRRGDRRGLREALRGLTTAGIDVLYDDRDERAGAKFATADLIGLPWQIIVGPQGPGRGRRSRSSARDRRARDAAPRRAVDRLPAGVRPAEWRDDGRQAHGRRGRSRASSGCWRAAISARAAAKASSR